MKKLKRKFFHGFTLIEIIIAIALMGVLANLIYGNFINSIKKGRDAKRKSDLGELQRALELYYEDHNKYPSTDKIIFGGDNKLCHQLGCNYRIYIQKIPNDPIQDNFYVFQSNENEYKIYSCIENNLDKGQGVKQEGYSKDCGKCGKCKYGVSSPNTSP